MWQSKWLKTVSKLFLQKLFQLALKFYFSFSHIHSRINHIVNMYVLLLAILFSTLHFKCLNINFRQFSLEISHICWFLLFFLKKSLLLMHLFFYLRHFSIHSTDICFVAHIYTHVNELVFATGNTFLSRHIFVGNFINFYLALGVTQDTAIEVSI